MSLRQRLHRKQNRAQQLRCRPKLGAQARRNAPNPKSQGLAAPAARENTVRGKPEEEGEEAGEEGTPLGTETLEARAGVFPMKCHGKLLAEHHSTRFVGFKIAGFFAPSPAIPRQPPP